MKFNPIVASEKINRNYKDYIKSTFYIKDEKFREEYNKEIEKFDFAKGPYLECVDAFKFGESLECMVSEGLISPKFKNLFVSDPNQYKRKLYLHQEIAFRTALENKNMIVTTGTGSGKTECFLYPILNYLLNEESNNQLCPGVRVLLLYPMNALANDQMQRLRDLLKNYPTITFGAYTGETEHKYNKAIERYRSLHNNEEPVSNEIISREEMIENPPHILVTNYAMLEYLLIRPKENVFFDDINYAKYWKYIVLDEAHVYSGATGMEVSILMRRLINRIPNNEKIRYILTSATLGDESSNEAILNFGTSLCANRYFDSTSIIRAIRNEVQINPEYSIELNFYREILSLIENTDKKEKDLKIQLVNKLDDYFKNNITYNREENSHEILYSIFSRDKLYFDIRKYLFDGAITIKELSDRIDTDVEKIINFISIASYAQRDGAKLLDAKYHHFIRTLEGAYISFYPKKTLSLVPKNTIVIDDKESQVFKLSVCQFCGTVYLEGEIKDNKLVQSSKISPNYFMVISDTYFTNKANLDKKNIKKIIHDKNTKTYTLCTKCGLITSSKKNLICDCSKEAHISLLKVKSSAEDNLIHKCEFCDTVSPRNSILRGFYLGQDSSTAVVCESLYNQLPKSKIKVSTSDKSSQNQFIPKKVEENYNFSKRLLMFSDSRQDAAYFASYFQYTYDIFFKRKLMLKTCRDLYSNYGDNFKEGIPLITFAKRMVAEYTKTIDSDMSFDIIEKETWKTIISEFKDFSRNGLHSIGWLNLNINKASLIENDIEIGGIRLSKEQARMIAQLILDESLKHGAILIPDSVVMTPNDWGDFDFGSKNPVLAKSSSGTKNTKFNIKSVIPAERNAITSYLDKIFKNYNIDSKKIIEDFFTYYFSDESIQIFTKVKGQANLYKVNPQKLVIKLKDYNNLQNYKCDICGRITSVNIDNICPSYRCNGKLHKFDFNKNDSKEYYLNQYNFDNDLNKLNIKEHTAQLSKETAQEYQQKFIEGKINILSCSTTFEMGVDVGNLESVFMKNIPPKPSNYIQRAGRAGRRLNSTAFSLTFCKLSPHDFYFFQNPTKMIDGKVLPPSFKIDNLKIVKRHVYAILLSKYWKELFENEDNISEFFNVESFNKIINFINNLPNEVYDYIEKVVPETLYDEIDNIISDYKNNSLVYSKDMYHKNINEYKSLIETLDSIEIEKKPWKQIDWLMKMKKTYKNEKIISYYSKNNLIPKYGFPVDTVELNTDLSDMAFGSGSLGLSLQRDLIQAISDYAPGSQVIADGKMFTSRYIKKPMSADKDWKQIVVEICENPNCGKITERLYTGDLQNLDKICPQCGHNSVDRHLILMPEAGFFIDPKIEIATTKKPKKTYRSQFYYLGEGFNGNEIKSKEYEINGVNFLLTSSPNDKLLVMNKSNFYVCDICGYSEVGTRGSKIEKEHNNSKDYKCRNKILRKKSLGHKFNTDVLIIQINRSLASDKAITILYSFLEGLSIKYDIDRDDIDGCISYQNYSKNAENNGTTFILFDSVPGGAGNVKRLYDSNKKEFIDFLRVSYDRVNNCNCGTNGNTVCYNCLSNFKNQFYQEQMKRKYVIDFLKELIV
ncbi:MAG: DEAD/DEAH box helicase [Sphaerochaetaceae bacterium]|nr:DEAD/DEAH box helicase [Sphaerochaetaceae bacterium]